LVKQAVKDLKGRGAQKLLKSGYEIPPLPADPGHKPQSKPAPTASARGVKVSPA
jgi:hypothetical protein